MVVVEGRADDEEVASVADVKAEVSDGNGVEVVELILEASKEGEDGAKVWVVPKEDGSEEVVLPEVITDGSRREFNRKIST